MSDDIGGYSLTLDSIQKLREDHNLLESMVFSAIGRRFMSRPFEAPAKKELEPFIHGFSFETPDTISSFYIQRIVKAKSGGGMVLHVDDFGKQILTQVFYHGDAERSGGGTFQSYRKSTFRYIKAVEIDDKYVVCWIEPVCIE